MEKDFDTYGNPAPGTAVGRLMEFLKKFFVALFCRMKAVTPAENDFSGIQLANGEVYRVFKGQDGNYYYVDKDGNMVYIDMCRMEIEGSSWVNIREMFVLKDRWCYRNTSGATMSLQRVRVFNNHMAVLIEYFEVLDSSSATYSVGQQLNSVPDGYTRVSCELYDEKFMTSDRICYETSNGILAVNIHKISSQLGRDTQYQRIAVLDSSNPSYVAGSNISSIPTGWTAVPCECRCVVDVNVTNDPLRTHVTNTVAVTNETVRNEDGETERVPLEIIYKQIQVD